MAEYRGRMYPNEEIAWAAECFDEVAAKPKNASLLLKLGQAHEDANDLPAALAAYQHALKLKPDYGRAKKLTAALEKSDVQPSAEVAASLDALKTSTPATVPAPAPRSARAPAPAPAPAPALPTLTEEEIDGMSIKEMKTALRERKIPHEDCFEKLDLITRLKENATGSSSAPAPAPAPASAPAPAQAPTPTPTSAPAAAPAGDEAAEGGASSEEANDNDNDNHSSEKNKSEESSPTKSAVKASEFLLPEDVKFQPGQAKASDEPLPADVTAMKAEGNECFKRGDNQEAIKAYTRAIKAMEEAGKPNAKLYTNRAAVYLKMEKFVGAAFDGMKAMETDNDWWKGYWYRGQAIVNMLKGKKVSSANATKAEQAMHAFQDCLKCTTMPASKQKEVEEYAAWAKQKLVHFNPTCAQQ